MTVGEKIYTLRVKAGFSQEGFAEVIGVSRQSVSKWETSVVMPDTEYVIKICKVLHVSADTLLIDDELPNGDVKTLEADKRPDSVSVLQQEVPQIGKEVPTLNDMDEIGTEEAPLPLNDTKETGAEEPQPRPEVRENVIQNYLESVRCKRNKMLTIVGFALSFVLGFLGVILCSIVVGSEKRMARINYMSIWGLSIGCVKFYATVTYVMVSMILKGLVGGI